METQIRGITQSERPVSEKILSKYAFWKSLFRKVSLETMYLGGLLRKDPNQRVIVCSNDDAI
jgi:hypothetical protein